MWTSIFSLQEQSLLLVQILNENENAASFANYLQIGRMSVKLFTNQFRK